MVVVIIFAAHELYESFIEFTGSFFFFVDVIKEVLFVVLEEQLFIFFESHLILELFVESVEVAVRISRHWKIFLGVLFLKTVSFGRLGGGGNYVVG